MTTPIAELVAADRAIFAAAKDVKVLSRLSWPADVMARFLDNWRKGNARLPVVTYPASSDLDAPLRALSAALNALDPHDGPLAEFLRSTASSYVSLCQLLQSAGSAAMVGHSRSLYGSPGDTFSDGKSNNLDAARHFLGLSEQYYQAAHLQEADYCLPPELLRKDIETRLAEVFSPGTIDVVVDARLVAKAAAGATRIRLRDDTCFSEYDLEQLLQHEAFVHSLTALNGRAQPNIQCLGLGAPRTTGAQEGLATFAELVTGAIDIDRLERIALRVVGIDMALRGADFIEIFRFFLDTDQSEHESFSSTMRIFRGAPLTGGAAFTKDVVYLHGLMEVHTFFRWAMRNRRMHVCRQFFAGRMTIGDALRLGPEFDSGVLAQPKYLPPWMARASGLAGYLAFSLFANKISLDALDEHHGFDGAGGRVTA